MNIYLIRHAIAENRNDFSKKNLEDSLRPLTFKGRKKMLNLLDWYDDWIKEVDLIVTSPYLRARQTAQILQRLPAKPRVVEAAELVPHSPPQAFCKWIKVHGKDKRNIIVVGHEPQLSLLAGFLVSGQTQSHIDLKKGGIACLEVSSVQEIEFGKARILWLVQPRLLMD